MALTTRSCGTPPTFSKNGEVQSPDVVEGHIKLSLNSIYKKAEYVIGYGKYILKKPVCLIVDLKWASCDTECLLFDPTPISFAAIHQIVTVPYSYYFSVSSYCQLISKR